MARRIGLDQADWLPVNVQQVQRNDGTSTIELSWAATGLARIRRGQQWEATLGEGKVRVDSVNDNVVTLSIEGQGPLGRTQRTVRVTLPKGSKDVRLLEGKGRLIYRLAPRFLDGTNLAIQVKLEAKQHLQGCLAKCYAEPKFGLWGARMVVKNTGDQALRNYRVRFQVVGYSPDWSEWQRCVRVLPGQTVVDPYFPVLDVDKVGRLEGVRSVYLKAQYQYRGLDGKVIDETETVRLELLGHNLVETASRAAQNGENFFEQRDLVPFVTASMVTCQDPVIQQVAGRVCHQQNGNAALFNDQDALKYLEGLYNFMATHVSYQSPPWDMANGRCRQHIKFGREVLSNHAGTCVDLAIFYASAVEAVGLEPLVVWIPGHVFPAVRLKNGMIYTVEATLIGKAGFLDALKRGKEEYEEVTSGKKPGVICNVKVLRSLGLHSLELPAVESDWLAKICPENKTRQSRTEVSAPSIVGIWRTRYQTTEGQVVTQVIKLAGDGTMAALWQVQNGQRTAAKGHYRYENGTLACKTNLGESQGTITWVDNNKLIYTDGSTKLEYVRVG